MKAKATVALKLVTDIWARRAKPEAMEWQRGLKNKSPQGSQKAAMSTMSNLPQDDPARHFCMHHPRLRRIG